MKTIYQCEICGSQSTSKDEIAQCEALAMIDPGVEIGDIVYSPSMSYGWWSGDEEWFFRQAGDPKSRSHFERAKIGYPLYVVVGFASPKEVGAHTSGIWGHRKLAILFSPSHANHRSRVHLGWTHPQGHCPMVKTGVLDPEKLVEYQQQVAMIRAKSNGRVALL